MRSLAPRILVACAASVVALSCGDVPTLADGIAYISPIVLPSMAEHVVAVCSTARASWYEDVGHMPFLEDSDRFDRELAEFAGHVH